MAKKINASFDIGWLAEQIIEQPRQPDEFSVQDAVAKFKTFSSGGMRNKLTALCNKGELTKRTIQEGSYRVTLYRKA